MATNSTLDRSQRRNASTESRFALQRFRQFAELLHLAPVDRLEQGLAGREMAIKRADADTGAFGHSIKARIRTAGAEHGLGGFQNPFTVANRIGAGPANGFCGGICHLNNLGIPDPLRNGGCLRICQKLSNADLPADAFGGRDSIRP